MAFGLQSTIESICASLVGEYYVNFERRLSELIRETKWLARMGVHIPEAAQLLLPQVFKFQYYHDSLSEMLSVTLLFLKPITHNII